MKKGDLSEAWAVVREDWHGNEFYVPFEEGGYVASEDKAKKRATQLQRQTHTKDHHHKMNFSAQPYDPEDLSIQHA